MLDEEELYRWVDSQIDSRIDRTGPTGAVESGEVTDGIMELINEAAVESMLPERVIDRLLSEYQGSGEEEVLRWFKETRCGFEPA